MKTSTEELLQSLNIVDVVSRHVKLRKAGKNYTGLCPFHSEKKPSFTVSPEKQMFYCFGCKEGGSAINFIMKYENLTFVEAIDHLERQYGIATERGANSKRACHYDVLDRLCGFYQKRLARSAPAREYLERRGITDDIASEFGLGYSMGPRDISWKQLHAELDAFIKASGIPADIFLSTGVVRMKDSSFCDMFGGRVMIPIIDVNKRVAGFGGRTLEKDGLPKYVNSPESSVFIKRNSLFGIDKTKKHIIDQDEAFIVEGYFDLISLYSAGIRNVVSTLGTSVTEGQISKLRNYTENITLMLDGDTAGIKSALRLIGLFAQMNVNGMMVVLPDGHDPDSFVREKGTGALGEIVKNKKPILDYYFDHYSDRKAMATIQGKQAFINQVTPHINSIANPIKRQLYIIRLSELTGVAEQHFAARRTVTGPDLKTNTPQSMAWIEKRVINACLEHPGLLKHFKGKETLLHIKNTRVREIITKLTAYFEQGKKLERDFIEQPDNEDLKELLLAAVFDTVHKDTQEPEEFVLGYVKHLEHQFFMERSKRITEKLAEAESRGDSAAVAELLKEQKQRIADREEQKRLDHPARREDQFSPLDLH
ncbi:MAG TPA: DNA primase [Syntrophorhabdaceae bacterium]|nr:DNA primase [Syntrophorhabdaceae bacterium]